jgi:3alpha(or 20beta)-hydroxysteroid dehydrogenase
MGRLDGKIAIVTGAARGQGEAEARLFAQEGARVIVGDVLDAEGRAVAAELGDAASFVHMDVSREEDWARAVRTAEDRYGPVSVLVNNAAITGGYRAIEDCPLENFMQVVAVNQAGTFLGMRAVIEPMRRSGGGSIVNISSIDGLQAKNGMVAYASTKWAIRGMTKVAALELGKHGIRVNSLHPGGVDTVMGNPAAIDNIDDFYREFPLPRCGKPIEMAYLALFLASDESSYCTGSEFVADGGWHAGLRMAAMPGY